MKVFSPSPTGNGANIIHKILQNNISGYSVKDYNPWLTLFPPVLSMIRKNPSVDIIHCPLDYACFFKPSGIPLVATAHNYVLDSFMQQFSSPLQRLHYKFDLRYFTLKSLRAADKITAVSHFVAKKLHEELGVRQDISVIYNGIDENIFYPSKCKPFSPRFKILFSGNLSIRKQAHLLRPLAKSLNSSFEVLYTSGLAGDKSIHSETCESGCILTRVGRIPYDKMPEIYHNVDALFMPSVREGFGLSIAEAMSCGLPIVANNCSAIPELVDHGKGGYLCNIGNLEEYSGCFQKLASSKTLSSEMGQYNRHIVEEKFTTAIMVEKYLQLFESARRSSL